MSIPPLPVSFNQTIHELYGASGQTWLKNLPQLITDCAQRWSLTILPPFPLSYNFVAPARGAGGAHYVLKLGVPNPVLSYEIAALHHFSGEGTARLVFGDAQAGVMLLERLLPGIAALPDLRRLLSRRLDLLAAELGLDRQRLHAWGLARAVLSGWWDYEDHGHGWEPVISVAEALAQI